MPHITALLMLRSTMKTVSAPANSSFRGSLPQPAHRLCTLRVRRHRRLTQHSLPGGLLGLTWAGLAPADRASFAGAFPLPTLVWGFRSQAEIYHLHLFLSFVPSLCSTGAIIPSSRPALRSRRRAGAVKVGRRTPTLRHAPPLPPHLDSFEPDGTLGAIGMTIRGEPAFGRGSIAPQPCIRWVQGPEP